MDFLVSDLVEGVMYKAGDVFKGNDKALALLDAETADDYIIALETQIEETEGALVYNAEDWIDAEVDACMNEFESELSKQPDITGQAKGELIMVMEDLSKKLKEELAKRTVEQVFKVEKVYT